MKVLINGLLTGLTLQLAIGPVFFFIINLALQRTLLDGLVGAIAVTLADYLYITLAILGIGNLLKNKRFKKIFGIISSIVLIVFGFVIIKNIINGLDVGTTNSHSISLISSFTSVFFLTISSPLTIVLFTGLFAAKTLEYNYSKKELFLFGLGTGFATFLFMSSSVILFSFIKEAIPILLIQISNILVGCLLIGYGGIRLIKNFKE